METDKESGASLEMDKCKPHIDTIDKKRTSFAQELMKDEEERRHMKEKLESDKNEDFKQQVDDMIEEINKLDVANTSFKDEADFCSKCEKEITEDALEVGDQCYHEECFTCDHCGESLTGKFYQVGDKKYCEADQEVGLDLCSVCGDYLRTGSVLVGGSSYHAHCFACSECDQPILDKFFTTEDGRWLCEEDYRMTKPRCSVCNIPVMDRMLTAMGRKFHPACFTCSVCQAVLDGKPFLAEGDVVHCKDCYARYKAAQCYRCGEAIVSTVGKRMTLITCDDKQYHYKCYSCKGCGKNLNGQQVFIDGDQVACADCKLQQQNKE